VAASHEFLAKLVSVRGRGLEAEAECRQALAIRQRLADDNPAVSRCRVALAHALIQLAAALLPMGREAEARTAAERAVILLESVIEEGGEPRWQAVLAEGLLRRGQARLAGGDSAASASDWRRALASIPTSPPREPEWVFLEACCHAVLAGAAGRSDSGVPAGERPIEADRAMDILHEVVAMGFRDVGRYRTETALGPLRGRDDFQRLIMDLAWPTEPFVRGD
jgi:tetratricopeptide (TPR) repeat protein